MYTPLRWGHLNIRKMFLTHLIEFTEKVDAVFVTEQDQGPKVPTWAVADPAQA